MNDLATENAVLAVSGFEFAVSPKRSSLHVCRQCMAEKCLITAKTGIEDRDLDALPALAEFVPGGDAKVF